MSDPVELGHWSRELHEGGFTLVHRFSGDLTGEELFIYEGEGLRIEFTAGRLAYAGNDMKRSWVDVGVWEVPVLGLTLQSPWGKEWSDLPEALRRKLKHDTASALSRCAASKYAAPAVQVRFLPGMEKAAAEALWARRAELTGISHDRRSDEVVGPGFKLLHVQHRMGVPPDDVFSYWDTGVESKDAVRIRFVADRLIPAGTGKPLCLAGHARVSRPPARPRGIRSPRSNGSVTTFRARAPARAGQHRAGPLFHGLALVLRSAGASRDRPCFRTHGERRPFRSGAARAIGSSIFGRPWPSRPAS